MTKKMLNKKIKDEILFTLENAKSLVGWVLRDEFEMEECLSEEFIMDALKKLQKLTAQVNENRPNFPYSPTMEILPLLYNIALLSEMIKYPISNSQKGFHYSRVFGNPNYNPDK